MLGGTDGGVLGAVVRIVGTDLERNNMAIEIAHGNEQACCPCEAPPAPTVALRHIETRDLGADVGPPPRNKPRGERRTTFQRQCAILSTADLAVCQASLTQGLMMGGC